MEELITNKKKQQLSIYWSRYPIRQKLGQNIPIIAQNSLNDSKLTEQMSRNKMCYQTIQTNPKIYQYKQQPKKYKKATMT